MLEGHSFIVGAAVSIGGRDIKPGINVHRFANRIPLLFEVRQSTAKLLLALQSVHSLLPACTSYSLTHFLSSAPNLLPPGDSSCFCMHSLNSAATLTQECLHISTMPQYAHFCYDLAPAYSLAHKLSQVPAGKLCDCAGDALCRAVQM